MCTTEEMFRCLDQFLTHHQINWQKHKLAVWTAWKQTQGKNSEGIVHFKTIIKVNWRVHGTMSGCTLAIDKMTTSFRTTLNSAIQLPILLRNSIYIVNFHVWYEYE